MDGGRREYGNWQAGRAGYLRSGRRTEEYSTQAIGGSWGIPLGNPRI